MILCTSSKCYLLCNCQQTILSSNKPTAHKYVTHEIGNAKVSEVNLSVNWRRNWTSEKTQDHLDICVADGTSTSLTFHLVRFAQASQKRWWPHGTSAIRASRWATRHTSQSFMSLAGVATVATTARNFLDLSSGAFANYAFAPSLLIYVQHCYVA